MSAVILLFLRIALAIALYAFLGGIIITIWRDLMSHAARLLASQVIPVRLSIQEEQELRELRFTKAEIQIGRDPGCDCPLDDKTVSTRHARLSFHHRQWWLEDLGSTNGTFLNQEPVFSPIVLTSGDQITCGKTSMIIHFETQAQ